MNAFLPATRRHGLLARPSWDLFDRMFEDWGKGLFTGTEDWAPSLDVTENEAEYIVAAELPGLTKEDIDVTLSEGLLTIKGEKREEKKEEKDHCHVVERHYGSFSRTLRLPGTVDASKVKAEAKDGVLRITLPKTGEAKTKKIEVTQ